jgi:hypothetical protein
VESQNLDPSLHINCWEDNGDILGK